MSWWERVIGQGPDCLNSRPMLLLYVYHATISDNHNNLIVRPLANSYIYCQFTLLCSIAKCYNHSNSRAKKSPIRTFVDLKTDNKCICWCDVYLWTIIGTKRAVETNVYLKKMSENDYNMIWLLFGFAYFKYTSQSTLFVSNS